MRAFGALMLVGMATLGIYVISKGFTSSSTQEATLQMKLNRKINFIQNA